MTPHLFHPSERDLLAFTDAAAAVADSTSVREHLAGCQHCRDLVTFMRRLSADALALRGPVADARLLAAIRDRVASKERVLLPVEASLAPRRSRRWFAAASLVFAIGGAWVVLGSNPASAGSANSELDFMPPSIQRTLIEVRYRPAGLFSTARSVVLRARYRTEWGEPYQRTSRQQTVAILTQDARGVFRGSLRIPDSVVYAAFSVEDEKGNIIDDNGHQLWYLMRRAPDGRPLLNAMAQRSNDLYGENMELALGVQQAESRMYPDSAAVWGGVVAMERFMLGAARADSTEPEHCARLARFDSYYRERMAVSVHDADALVQYSVQLDKSKCPVASPVGRYWQDRVLNDPSGGVESDVRRYSRDMPAVINDPARSVALADKYWPLPGFAGTMLANNGAMAAVRGHDGPAALKWADRSVARDPALAGNLYSRLVPHSDIHQVAIDRLRQTLRRLESREDSLRPLEATVAEQARRDSAASGQVLAAIGKALIADGQMRAGSDTLRLATERGWDARLFRDVARQLETIGDTVGATRLLARVVADPSSTVNETDSITKLAEPRVSPARWRTMVDSAQALLRREMLADAIRTPIKGRVRLQALDGHKTDLTAIAKGRVTVVSFWSRTCGFSVQQFPMITSLAHALEQRGIVLVPVFNEKPSRDIRKYVDDVHVTVPTFSDTWGDATRALHDFGTPVFFVIDAAGRVRYRYSSIDKVLAQAVAIQQDEAASR